VKLFTFADTEQSFRLEEKEGKSRAIPAARKLALSLLVNLDQADPNAATRRFSERLIGRAVHGRDMQWQASTWAARPNGG
jgi:hypothetical protein